MNPRPIHGASARPVRTVADPRAWYARAALAVLWALAASAGDGLAQPLGPPHPFVLAEKGGLPIILTSPHGGHLAPDSLADRSCDACILGNDGGTQEWARETADAFERATGRRPYLVINLLARRKLDANREIVEAADGDPHAESAWAAFHAAVEEARADVEARYGRGLLIDLHGHGHPIRRLELGILLSAIDLSRTPDGLNSLYGRSSLRALAERTGGLAALVRGPDAMGTLFADRGIPAVPSAQDPFPGPGEAYFTGGYITQRHGSRDGGTVDAVQIEAPGPGLRDTPANIRSLALATASVLEAFLARQYGLVLDSRPAPRPAAETCLELESVPAALRVRVEPSCLAAREPTARIIDVLGRTLLAVPLQPGSFEIDLDGFAAGLHFLVIDSGARRSARSFVLLPR